VLATRQSGFTDEQLLKMYICGLKDYIRSEIKLWNPKTIEDARHAARLIEQKDKFNKPSFAGPEASNKYSNEKPNKYSTDKSNPDKKWVNKCRYCGDNWFPGHKCDNKKLYTCKAEKESDSSSSESERENKKKNNCRKCGENWTPRHRCEDKSLRYFRIVDGKQVEVSKTEDEITIAYNADSDHDEIPQKASLASISCVQKNRNEENKLQREIITPKYIPPHLRKDKSQPPRKEESKPTVPLATMTGKPQPKTLKLKGVIKDRNLTILVDSGSTHNCIDIDVAKKLNLFIYPTKDLTVKVANGQRVKEVGKCHKISVQIQELELQTGFYALPLEGMDMVLGAEWLIQLGSYATNLEEQFMEFNWQGQHYKLYGVEGSTLKKNQLPPTEKCQ
jgi:hypothetical protein